MIGDSHQFSGSDFFVQRANGGGNDQFLHSQLLKSVDRWTDTGSRDAFVKMGPPLVAHNLDAIQSAEKNFGSMAANRSDMRKSKFAERYFDWVNDRLRHILHSRAQNQSKFWLKSRFSIQFDFICCGP